MPNKLGLELFLEFGSHAVKLVTQSFDNIFNTIFEYNCYEWLHIVGVHCMIKHLPSFGLIIREICCEL